MIGEAVFNTEFVNTGGSFNVGYNDGNVDFNTAINAMAISYPNVVEMGTTEYWNGRSDYVPKKGKIIVYTDAGQMADGTPVQRIKVADGLAYIVDQPFVNADLIEILNRKVSVTIDGEVLVFYI